MSESTQQSREAAEKRQQAAKAGRSVEPDPKPDTGLVER